jgi:2,3-bisphosphoglycerate-dependent phosphoglycerate mutase
MAVLKLLLVRHAQSVGNVEGRMEGTSSTGLTELGRHQAIALGQALAAQGWLPTHSYCSPLERATATLAHLRAGLGPAAAHGPTTLLDDLKEYDAGIFTGLTWATAQQRYPDLCHRLETSLDWHPIPQAETPQQGQARSQRVVDRLLEHGNGDRLLVLSHHWILQQVIARLLGSDRAWGLPMANTGCFELWIDRDRWDDDGPNRLNTELWRIRRFNDTGHLGAV